MKYLLDQQELDELKNRDQNENEVTYEQAVRDLREYLASELTMVLRSQYLYDSPERQLVVRMKDLRDILDRFKPTNKKTSQ